MRTGKLLVTTTAMVYQESFVLERSNIVLPNKFLSIICPAFILIVSSNSLITNKQQKTAQLIHALVASYND